MDDNPPHVAQFGDARKCFVMQTKQNCTGDQVGERRCCSIATAAASASTGSSSSSSSSISISSSSSSIVVVISEGLNLIKNENEKTRNVNALRQYNRVNWNHLEKPDQHTCKAPHPASTENGPLGAAQILRHVLM
jgi:hypothetical protein